MAIKNTDTSYGSIAKWLHWLTAALFLAAYMSVYYRQWFTEEKTPANWTALQLHLSIGITIGVIVVLRIIWKILNRTPDLEPGSRLEHLAAHGVHYGLYAIMIIMPITGYMGTGANTEYFSVFEIQKFEDTRLYSALVTDKLGLSFEQFEAPLDFIHKNILGEWLVWILITGHALAALYHHVVKKDQTLTKMTTKKA